MLNFKHLLISKEQSLRIAIIVSLILKINSQYTHDSIYKQTGVNQDITTGSLNLITTFIADRTKCLNQINSNLVCKVAVMRSNGECSLYKDGALNEIVSSGVPTSLFVKQKQIPINTVGLVNYWPIQSDVNDLVGLATLKPGTVTAFGPDRFNNSNSALLLSNSYYLLPPGVYFTGAFTILAWVKILSISNSGRLVDCGNGVNSDNVIACYSTSQSNMPFIQVYHSSGTQNSQISTTAIALGQWTHLAYVLDTLNQVSYVYINGVVTAATNGTWAPLSVVRNQCYLGRSSWYPGDQDANAYFDEIKFYNLALSQSQIVQDMNQLPFY